MLELSNMRNHVTLFFRLLNASSIVAENNEHVHIVVFQF